MFLLSRRYSAAHFLLASGVERLIAQSSLLLTFQRGSELPRVAIYGEKQRRFGGLRLGA